MKDVRCLAPDEIGKNSPIKLEIMQYGDECDYIQPIMMLETIIRNNAQEKPSMFIVPVGPIGYARRLAWLVNEYNVSLKNVTLLNMDEYMITETELIDPRHPLSFKRAMNDGLYSQVRDELNVLPENRVFPDPADPLSQWRRIQEKEGGVDICFGGIGMDGHIAFNEPPLVPMTPEEFAELHTRVLPIYYTTQVTNSIEFGGNYKGMPRYCVSIGMKEILSSQKLVFFSDWAAGNNSMKQVIDGPITAEVPGSLMQTHKDCTIYTTRELLETPLVI